MPFFGALCLPLHALIWGVPFMPVLRIAYRVLVVSLLVAGLFAEGATQAAVKLGDAPQVVARSYGPLPEEKVIAVEYDMASEMNEWIRATMVRDLERRGYEVRDDAGLVLRFRSQLRSDQDSGTRFSLQAGRGIDRDSGFQLDYSVPLGERPGIGSSTYFAITATAQERGKQALWQGTASARARHRRAVELQPAVITSLLNALGKTVGSSND
jgi:hypothetical protein